MPNGQQVISISVYTTIKAKEEPRNIVCGTFVKVAE